MSNINPVIFYDNQVESNANVSVYLSGIGIAHLKAPSGTSPHEWQAVFLDEVDKHPMEVELFALKDGVVVGKRILFDSRTSTTALRSVSINSNTSSLSKQFIDSADSRRIELLGDFSSDELFSPAVELEATQQFGMIKFAMNEGCGYTARLLKSDGTNPDDYQFGNKPLRKLGQALGLDCRVEPGQKLGIVLTDAMCVTTTEVEVDEDHEYRLLICNGCTDDDGSTEDFKYFFTAEGGVVKEIPISLGPPRLNRVACNLMLAFNIEGGKSLFETLGL